MSTLASLEVKLIANMENLKAGIEKSQKLTEDLKNSIERTSRNTESNFLKMGAAAVVLQKSLGLAFGAVSDIIKTTANFDAAIAKVGAVTQVTASELAQLRETALELGSTSVFTSQQVAEGMAVLGAAGISATEDIKPAMEGILALAAAADTDLTQATEIAVSAMNSFGLAASDMTHIADTLALSAQSSAVSVADIGNSLKYVGPVAAASGQSLEEVLAAITAMGEVGIKSEQAGTTLRAMLASLVDPSNEAAGVLEKLGINVVNSSGGMMQLNEIAGQFNARLQNLTETQRNQALSTIFGREALSGSIAVFAKGQEGLLGYKDALAAADGVASKMANDSLNSLNGQLTQVESKIEGLKIAIGEGLTPALKLMAQDSMGVIWQLQGIVTEIGNLAGTTGLWDSWVSGIRAVIKEVESMLATVRAGLAALNALYQLREGNYVAALSALATAGQAGKQAGMDMVVGKAAGGFVSGPGSGTSDSIPAMLSNGEFVINAASTKRFMPLLEAINAKKFAAGGVVGYASGGSVATTGSNGLIDVNSLVLTVDTANVTQAMIDAINADAAETDALLKVAMAPLIMEAQNNEMFAESIESSANAIVNYVTASENGLIAFANETAQTAEKVKGLGDTSNVAAKAQQDFSISTSGMTETMKRFMENASDPIQNTTFKNEQLYTDFNDAIKKVAGSFTANISALFPYLEDAQKQYDTANKSIWKLWNGASVALDFTAVKAQHEGLLRNLDAQNKRAEREAQASIRAEEMAAQRQAMLESMYAIQNETGARNTATMGLIDGATRQMATNMQLAESFESTRSRIHESGEAVNLGFQGMLSSMNDGVMGYVQKTQEAGDIIKGSAIMAMDEVVRQVEYSSGAIQAALNPLAASNSDTLPGGTAFLDPFKNYDPSRPRDGGQAPISVYVDGQKLFNIMQDRAGSYGASNVGTGFN